MTPISGRERLFRLGAAAALAAGVAVSYAVAPDALPLPPCAFRQWTGASCLTCGLTRSFHATARGELGAAFGYHAVGPLLFAGAVWAALVWSVEALAGRSVPLPGSRRLLRWAVAAIGCAWLGWWVVRLVLESR